MWKTPGIDWADNRSRSQGIREVRLGEPAIGLTLCKYRRRPWERYKNVQVQRLDLKPVRWSDREHGRNQAPDNLTWMVWSCVSELLWTQIQIHSSCHGEQINNWQLIYLIRNNAFRCQVGDGKENQTNFWGQAKISCASTHCKTQHFFSEQWRHISAHRN